MPPARLHPILSGIAGEYFVAAELSRRGFIASLTLKNTRGIDILASNTDATRSVGIQVKTNRRTNRAWLLSVKSESKEAANLCYVFVNLNDGVKPPSYHIVPSDEVAAFVKKSHARWLATPGRGGRPHTDTPMRQFLDPDGKYLDRWDLLGLD